MSLKTIIISVLPRLSDVGLEELRAAVQRRIELRRASFEMAKQECQERRSTNAA